MHRARVWAKREVTVLLARPGSGREVHRRYYGGTGVENCIKKSRTKNGYAHNMVTYFYFQTKHM
jgi:hypothetical protein